MASWEWIALGLGFLGLVQLLAFRYARRIENDDDRSGPQPTPPVPTERGTGRTDHRPDSDTVVCEHCGARNAAEYTYCRSCVQPVA